MMNNEELKRKLKPGEREIVGIIMDLIQSMSRGRWGWGHDEEYVRNDTRQKEAFANEFMLYVTNNKRGELDFPETWKYFNMIMDRLKQRGKI